jgi:hypothetical protein
VLTSLGFECVQLKHVGDPTYLAFNEVLFRAAILIERLLERTAPHTHVHLVGLYRKM